MNLQNEIINSRWLFQNDSNLSAYLELANQVLNTKISIEHQKSIIAERDDRYKITYVSKSTNSNKLTVSDTLINNSYAVLKVQGAITKNNGLSTKGTDAMRSELKGLGENKDVKGVILSVNSPGGSVWGTQEFSNEIKNFETKYNKPIASFIDGGMACSAGYWLASSAPKIFMSSGTCEAGCIGTMVTIQDQTERLNQMGVKEIVINASKSYNKNAAFNEAKNGNYEPLIKDILDPINEEFINSVKSYRGSKITNEDVLSGKTYIGKNAIDAGLVDGIGTLDDVVSYLDNESLKINSNVINSLKSNSYFLNKHNNINMNFKLMIDSVLKNMGITSLNNKDGNTITLEQIMAAMPDGSYVSHEELEALVNSKLDSTRMELTKIESLTSDLKEFKSQILEKIENLNSTVNASNSKIKDVSEVLADSQLLPKTLNSSNGSNSHLDSIEEDAKLTWEGFIPQNQTEVAYKLLGENNPLRRSAFLEEIEKKRKHKK